LKNSSASRGPPAATASSWADLGRAERLPARACGSASLATGGDRCGTRHREHRTRPAEKASSAEPRPSSLPDGLFMASGMASGRASGASGAPAPGLRVVALRSCHCFRPFAPRVAHSQPAASRLVNPGAQRDRLRGLLVRCPDPPRAGAATPR
jgi:hypothetical protein